MRYIKKYWILIVVVYLLAMFIKPAICCLVIGGLCFYGGASAIIFLNKIHNRGIESVGKVLSYNLKNKGHKTPVIEFAPVNGDVVVAEPTIYTSTDLSKIRSYSKMINTKVLILYDPEDPKKFVLLGDKSLNYIFFFLLILAGLVFFTFSILDFLGIIKTN